LLATNRFISVHFTTIFRALERAGVSGKKLKKIAKKRNETLRAHFIARMAQYEPEELGFLDETSKDERTIARIWEVSEGNARFPKGCLCVCLQKGSSLLMGSFHALSSRVP
jgi:hypothetical protein